MLDPQNHIAHRFSPPEKTNEPAGSQIGNDRPIVHVQEVWTSPDLHVTVLTKTSDPRSGESTIRLQNIDRSEPDAAFFRAPADYQVIDENNDRVEIKITRSLFSSMT